MHIETYAKTKVNWYFDSCYNFLLSEKDLRKNGRGSVSLKYDMNSGLTIVRWYGNKCVQVASTYSTAESSGTVERWDPKSKRYLQVPCPDAVKEYNSAMGGVDLVDMLIALYRAPLKTSRWYIKALVHCADICKVNAWLLYRRYITQLSIQLTLVQFTTKVADGLMFCRKPIDRPVGRPSKRKSLDDAPAYSCGRSVQTATPNKCIRTDKTGHWPVYRDKKNKCQFCKKGIIRTSCIKCEVYLCFTSDRNCFYEFHCY